ncbi:uncharacterized protein J3R85_008120 [Psidium guajava]|nr:uncharacterized protein J3R85_008120 [Psidium guajava]
MIIPPWFHLHPPILDALVFRCVSEEDFTNVRLITNFVIRNPDIESAASL